MAAEISPAFQEVFRDVSDDREREYNFDPNTYAQRTLRSIVRKKYLEDLTLQKIAITKYGPLTEWLAKPRTIDEFNALKSNLYELTCHLARYQLLGDLEMRISLNIDENKWEDRKEEWYKTLGWVFSLCNTFNIWPKENIDHVRKMKRSKAVLGASVFGDIESPDYSIPLYQENPFTTDRFSDPPEEWLTRNQLLHTSKDINMWRKKNYFVDGEWNRPRYKRVGLIIADLRVGDHLAHGRLLEKAKHSLGAHGILIVIIPSNKTIFATTSKTESWSNEDRLYRMRSNRFVDMSLIVDMPKKHYSNPNAYWAKVWKVIRPDFVFLGEENHPLESLYIEESKKIGGILLVDKVPITRRSGDILRIK